MDEETKDRRDDVIRPGPHPQPTWPGLMDSALGPLELAGVWDWGGPDSQGRPVHKWALQVSHNPTLPTTPLRVCTAFFTGGTRFI